MIRAHQICKSYERGRRQVVALSNVSFEIAEGERVALLGRSGSGKTTLLNLLAGLDRVTSGDLTVHTHPLSKFSVLEMDQYRQSTVGVVFQQFRLIKHKTAAQNVALPLVFSQVARKQRRERVAECLQLVGLQDRASHKPAELSGGEQQRVAVARAICHSPKLLLADEPTGNLDSSHATQIMELLVRVQQEVKTTLILITHDEELARDYTTRILRLQDGHIVDSDPVAVDHPAMKGQ